MADQLKTAVIGLGGVGGYFGYKLIRHYRGTEGSNITFIARNETYTIVDASGLLLLSPEVPAKAIKPTQLLNAIEALPPMDLILLSVKEYDLDPVLHALKDKITAQTVILPLLNGVDIYESVRRIIANGIVLPACVYVASHLKSKGVVEHNGRPGKIIAGKDPLHLTADYSTVSAFLKEANIDFELREDAFADIWQKFCFICSFGLVSAAHDKTIGEVNTIPVFREKASAVIKEILAVAEAKKISLPADMMEKTFQKAATFPFDTPTSLQLDVRAKKHNTELALFTRPLLEASNAFNIDVSHTRELYEVLKTSANYSFK